MASFCGQCGAPVGQTGFCGKCGFPIGEKSEVARPKGAATPQAVSSSPQKGMSAAAKLGIAAIAIIFVGGAAAAAGIYYVAHRASQKFHEVTGGITGDRTRNASSSSSSTAGDPCRFMSRQDVSQAIGVEIVEARPDGDACSYFAKGNKGDMAAKHAAKMIGAKGAAASTQKMAEEFGAAIFKSMPQEKQEQGSDGSDLVPVLSFSVSDSPSATAEMKLNAKIMKQLGGSRGPATGEDLDIGDRAFSSADGMIMFSKGDKVVRIMYTVCPCGTKEVIPLAKQLASAI